MMWVQRQPNAVMLRRAVCARRQPRRRSRAASAIVQIAHGSLWHQGKRLVNSRCVIMVVRQVQMTAIGEAVMVKPNV